MRSRARTPAAVQALLLGGLALSAPAARLGGQDAGSDPSAAGRTAAGTVNSSATVDSLREAPLPVPEKRSVHQYRLGLDASVFSWDADARAEDGMLAGIEVERDLASFLAARAQLAYGTTQLTRAEGTETLDTRVYLPEIALLLQVAGGPLRGSRAVPYALAAFGALITDPDRSDLTTRSQNAFAYGAGVRLRFGERLGVRGEVKRYLIKLEDAFDTSSRESESIHNTRFGGSLTYAL